MQIETVRTERFSMEYFRFGSGSRTLVILPGLSVRSVMTMAAAVAKEYEVMQEDFSVYVLDRRAELPAVYTVADMARDTAEAMTALGLRDVCLFGASQGGMIAMTLAIEHPELVGRLALGSTAACMHGARCDVLREWVDLARAKDREVLYLAFSRAIYPAAVFAQYRDALVMLAGTLTDGELERFCTLAEGTEGFCELERLDRIQCPVLLIGAADDAVLSPGAGEEIAERLKGKPDFTYYEYVGYGHAAFDTAPDYRERLYRFFVK